MRAASTFASYVDYVLAKTWSPARQEDPPQVDVEKGNRAGAVVAKSNLEAYVGCANDSHRLDWGGWRSLIHPIERDTAYV